MFGRELFRPDPDTGNFIVQFEENEKTVLEETATFVKGLLTGVDEQGATNMLFPPAYGDDFMRQVEYDRLMKEQLAESHVAALDILLSVLEKPEVDADQILGFMRAVNQIRLVIARPLELSDETSDEDFPEDHEQYDTYMIYRYLTGLQSEAVDALDDGLDDGEDDPADL